MHNQIRSQKNKKLLTQSQNVFFSIHMQDGMWHVNNMSSKGKNIFLDLWGNKSPNVKEISTLAILSKDFLFCNKLTLSHVLTLINHKQVNTLTTKIFQIRIVGHSMMMGNNLLKVVKITSCVSKLTSTPKDTSKLQHLNVVCNNLKFGCI